MHKRFVFILLNCFTCLLALAQTPKPVAAPVGKRVYNFKTVNPKLQYVFIDDKPTTGHPQEGDDVMMRMIALCNNRFMYSTSQLNKGKPGAFSISKPAFTGDISDVLMLMTPGDSVICLVDAQSMYEYSKTKMPDFIKPGDKIQYNIRLVSIKPRAQVQKEREAEMMKAMQGQDAGPAMQQKLTDDVALQQYFNSKNIKPVKTASGMYYSIQKQGSGPVAAPGETVIMNYRGTFLDGTIFDSNIDSAFMHVQPLNFALGTGRVIAGWEEGITYLNAGSKAFFYLPSHMAYGTQSRSGNAGNSKGIPPNSVLVFEVELIEIKRR